MLRARTHVAGSRLMLRAQTHVARSIFFPPEIFQPTKQKPRAKLSQRGVTELARWHKTAYVLHFLSCYALRAMLLAQFFWGTVFFPGGFQSWASTVSLSQHDESEWARWVWLSTVSLSEHGWVWVSTVSLREQHGVPKFEAPPNLRFAVGDWAKISPD